MLHFRAFINESFNDALKEPSSLAAKQAKEAGLTYFGFGKYGKDGAVTHIVLNGKLTPFKSQVKQNDTTKLHKQIVDYHAGKEQNKVLTDLKKKNPDQYKGIVDKATKTVKNSEAEEKEMVDAHKLLDKSAQEFDKFVDTKSKESDKLHQTLLTNYDLTKIAEFEKSAVKLYSDGDYNQQLTDYLNTGKDAKPKVPLKNTVKVLDNLINDHQAPANFSTYVGLSPDFDLKPGVISKMPAYRGTTLDMKTAMKFSGFGDADNALTPKILEFGVKKGQKGFYTAGLSDHPEEKEFLLPRDTSIRLTGEPKLVHHSDGKMLQVYQAEIVDPEEAVEAEKTSKKSNHLPTIVVDGVRATPDGKALPEHIAHLKIPPAWTDVTYDPNPDADLMVSGKDMKGRVQAIYSAKFSQTQAAAKFARIKELDNKFKMVVTQNAALRKSEIPKIRDSADALALIMATGIRPGSDSDTGAEKQAYGATTLEGRHVFKTKKGVELRFVGKKGVSLKIPITDPEIADMVFQRAVTFGPKAKLFPHTNNSWLLAHTHELDGGSFKVKDFRTLLGTKTAIEEVNKVKNKPTSEKAYKKAVREVAKVVAQKLGNTPIVALQSYISPSVFAEWRAGVSS